MTAVRLGPGLVAVPWSFCTFCGPAGSCVSDSMQNLLEWDMVRHVVVAQMAPSCYPCEPACHTSDRQGAQRTSFAFLRRTYIPGGDIIVAVQRAVSTLLAAPWRNCQSIPLRRECNVATQTPSFRTVLSRHKRTLSGFIDQAQWWMDGWMDGWMTTPLPATSGLIR